MDSLNGGKILVLAEKPDMGRTIAQVIEPRARKYRTHLEGERYIITWAIGHLITLAEPDSYDPKYKRWNFRDLPIMPDAFKIVASRRTMDQLKAIGELGKQCHSIVNACDAGREGQYIFALIEQYWKWRKPVKRLWISDLTPETIRRGFDELQDASAYANLTAAARARSEADWLIGMNASRAFTTRHKTLLSVGRVQTPVLALIYDRQQEIDKFESDSYFEVTAQFQQEELIYKGTRVGDRIRSEEEAERLKAKLTGKPGRIADYQIKDGKEFPYRLYDLTLLQREANGKYGFSAKKTLDIAQSLYEKHKVITYPRTNSNYLTEQNVGSMHDALRMLNSMDQYREWVSKAEPNRVHTGNKAICQPSKVEDHHAILPTKKRPGTLAPDEMKVYDMIVRRMLSHFYPPATFTLYTVLTEVDTETFKTNVKQWTDRGWKVLYDQDERTKSSSKKSRPGSPADDDGEKGRQDEPEEWNGDKPFHVDAANTVSVKQLAVEKKTTQPPKAYTEGTLLKAMESAGKQLENEELRDAMKDSGLGTPATRAATIERLKQVGYVGMTGKRITLTLKGKTAVELIRHAGVQLLTSPEMTGQWERRLTQIARGEASNTTFMEAVRKFTLHVIDCVDKQRPLSGELVQQMEEEGSKKRGSKTAGKSKKESISNRAKGKGQEKSSVQAPEGLPESDSSNSSPSLRTNTGFGACPRSGCGGLIIEGRKGYGCTHFKQGCSFVIWKKQKASGKTISETMLLDLLTKGRTQLLSFTNGGSKFKGRLLLSNPVNGDLSIEQTEA
ncbi:type IA DNA topoisomerase [Paenibacillus sp. UMB4589-SE434]|uniref:type IA DNA topoisomerase n=1 Tax=Paenibacillus sp. UMB4589-SE434 TaxID=3046314 RepID=UPI00254D3DF5|nr:type IA DNA topoisomerase [Paenibacillus sp. UMB4589-SE434]MDK8180354.1 DNA topoisomerase 3 [Paenibacillus sp. UMB4589-SE434]